MLRYAALVVLALAVVAVIAGCPKPAPPPPPPPTGPMTDMTPSGPGMPGASATPDKAVEKPAADKAPDSKSKGPKVEGEEGKSAKKTPSGLEYIVLDEGKGEKPKTGDVVEAEYTGWLTDGTKFDTSKGKPEPFKFPVGVGQVIPAWDEALSDMKVGERRKLIVPPKLGYGEMGTPGGPIPPNATLVFEVKLVKIVK